MSSTSISLNKYISDTGLCSRRQADKYIQEGRVKINGRIAQKGNRVVPGDKVSLNGKPIKTSSKPKTYIILNKPPGITCTTDQRDKSNIIDFIGHKERIFPIGRLDKASSGLIILTSDGDIVNKVLRKEHHHEKEYIVTVNKPINDEFIKAMSKSIPMLGTKTMPAKVKQIGTDKFKIILTQGLNRQIRRMVEYCGYKVKTLRRVRIMHIHLGDLKEGRWRPLTSKEVSTLTKATSQS